MLINRFAQNHKSSTETGIILFFQEDFKSSASPYSWSAVYYSLLNKNGAKHKEKKIKQKSVATWPD